MFLTSCNETINFVLSTFLLAPVFQRNGVPVSMGPVLPRAYRNFRRTESSGRTETMT